MELLDSPRTHFKMQQIDNDWHTSTLENNLREGGHFFFRTEMKNGSAGFDPKGAYQKVLTHKRI